MSDKRSIFPLPLSSVTGTGKERAPQPARVATPQTATRNAAAIPAPRAGTVAAPRAAQPAPPQPPQPRPAAPQPLRAQPSAPPPRPAAAPLPVARSEMMVSDAIRRAMVQRVARQGVQDPAVLAALESVPRHLFIDPALSAQAYIDASLPIGHQQTISQPYIVARMIEVLRNGGSPAKVLEIGTGCGYQAAVLSLVAREVYSIERIKPLHELAKANLRPLRIANLRLHYGDGMLGLPAAAPFDGIILACAGLEVPQALLEQLAIGGRLVAPVGAHSQRLELVTRTGKAGWTRETLEDCHFVPLRPGTA